MEKFTVWLLEELNKRDWKPADLANRAKMTTGALSNIMSGHRKPGPGVCRAIAQAMNETPEHVFRVAGLLPPLPSSNDGIILKDIIEIVKRLPDEDRQEVLNYAKMRYENRQKKKKPPKTLEVKSKPAPAIIERLPMIRDDIPPETVAKVRALVERLTVDERANLIEYLLSRRDFVEALKMGGVEVPPAARRKTQEASAHKAQE